MARHLTIGRYVWEIRICRIKEKLAGCPDYEDRVIKIDSEQGTTERRWTAVHEIIHAACPRLAEGTVERIEDTLRNFQYAHPDLWP